MNYVCTVCRSSFGSPNTVTPDSSYRLANRRKACPKCGATQFVGTDTPRGLAILARVEDLLPRRPDRGVEKS